MAFVLYLGGMAIMNGFKSKESNRAEKEKEEEQIKDDQDLSLNENNLSGELIKLNELRKSGVLTQEEFDKAKNKLLDN